MQLALEDKTPLRGDFVLRAIQRFDLTPIPSTLELLLRADSTLRERVADGSVLLAGTSMDRYRIVQLRRAPTEYVQGEGGAVQALEVTAVLEPFAALAWPMQRAVIKDSTTLGEVYRSCGARARIASDVPVQRFACFAGQFPTEGIAQLLHEEAVVPVWSAAAALSFVRLADLFTGRAVDGLAADTTRAVQSQFRERHEVPWALSVDAAGQVLLGRRDTARPAVFLPRTTPRVLDNMTRCLVVRRTFVGTYAGHLRAGDGFDVAGVRHVIATVAHTWASGGSGVQAEQTSRLWLAQLQR